MRIRNYSERTIRTYSNLLGGFFGHIKKPPSDITGEDLKDYIYYRLKEGHISVSTVNQIISAWRIVHVHLLGKEWEIFRIVRPRGEKRLPEILSQKEARSLVNAPKNLKHRVMLHLMYTTGLRRGELLSLKLCDIDSARMVINIRQGKGKKDRQAILSANLLDNLREYYTKYRPKEYLFEGYSSQGRYSATSLSKVIKTSASKAGIKKPVSAHTLRHCFATHMLEKGVNLKVIQQLMGHVSLRTTIIYLSMANIDMKKLPNLLDDGQ